MTGLWDLQQCSALGFWCMWLICERRCKHIVIGSLTKEMCCRFIPFHLHLSIEIVAGFWQESCYFLSFCSKSERFLNIDNAITIKELLSCLYQSSPVLYVLRIVFTCLFYQYRSIVHSFKISQLFEQLSLFFSFIWDEILP